MTTIPRRALVLQGGGALGAYQAGAIEGLADGGIDLNWVLGTSIGAINAALYAGNTPAHRIARLREFWRRVSLPSAPATFQLTPASRRWQRARAVMSTMLLGVPRFFGPRSGMLWWDWNCEVPSTEASFYTIEPLRETLEELIDFDYLNSQVVRFSATAVNVETAELVVFDNTERSIDVRHILASCALPPGFPAIRIDGRLYWDGGVYSNTPLDLLLSDRERTNSLCFVVDLWQQNAVAPRSINAVFSRQKDIQYGSRSREHLEVHRRTQNLRRAIRQLIDHVPGTLRDPAEFEALAMLGCSSVIHVMNLGLHSERLEDKNKDLDFDAQSISRRQKLGIADVHQALREAPWTRPLAPGVGLAVHTLGETRA